MKFTFELDIPDETFKTMIQQAVVEEMKKYVTNWARNRDIAAAIDRHWKELIDPVVQEEMKKAPELRDRIFKDIERRISSQLRTLVRLEGQKLVDDGATEA